MLQGTESSAATNPGNRKASAIGNQRRELILSAAEKEFEKHGFGGSRMQRIADLANLPKANVHYYFNSKQALYNAVLDRIITLWDQTFPILTADDDPGVVLTEFVRKKVAFTYLYPSATRIFTSEILHGGYHLTDELHSRMTRWTLERASVIDHWVQQGKIKKIDSLHLIFLIWSSTQHFAQSEIQIKSVYQKDQLDKQDYDKQAASLTSMVLRICGLDQNPEKNTVKKAVKPPMCPIAPYTMNTRP